MTQEQTEFTQAEFQVNLLLEQIAEMSKQHAHAIIMLKTRHALELQQVAQLNEQKEPVKKTAVKKAAALPKGTDNDQ